MAYRFQKHYTRQEARRLLPEINDWLDELRRLRDRLAVLDQTLRPLLSGGADLGGRMVHEAFRAWTAFRETLLRFAQRQIQIKDIDRGLIDFPAIIAGKEVFLCWEQGEQDIDYWHDLDSGFAGREPID
jgi:hypothetical protein